MAQPQYKLSAPNTGSYQLAPQASPVSVFTRTKQLDPKFETDQNQIKAFQSFVKDIADWRGAENKDNREQAKLRALADDARGELDANLEAEDEDYQKYGRFLQGKNYSKEIGSRLVAEITVGSEGKLGLMDQAFADAKKPENANRKVEDIFSELLEDRKDYYRSQVPDSSDEFYSGFGEGFQPFANEINKAFFEKVQKETYSDRRDNFSQAFRSDIEQAVTFLQDPNVPDLEKENFKKQNKFDHNYLRRFSEKYWDSAGLSGDAALGEAIRIWSSEIENLVLKADSEEELEVAQEMLAVFITNNENGIKLLDISVFQKEARSNYVSLTNAINSKKDEIEAEEEKDKKEKRSQQEIQAVLDVVKNPDEFDVAKVQEKNPNLEAEDLTQLITLQQKLQDRKAKVVQDPKEFGQLLVDAKQGKKKLSDVVPLFNEKKLTEENFETLVNAIIKSRKYDPKVFQLFENRITQGLRRLPPGLDLKFLESSKPEVFRKLQENLLDLQETIVEESENILEQNTGELDAPSQLELLKQVRESTKVKEALEKYDNFMLSNFGEPKTPEKEAEETREQQLNSRYLESEDGWEDLYEDYYAYFLKNRANAPITLDDDNLFKGLDTGEAKTLFNKLYGDPNFNKPLIEGKPYGFNNWAKDEIFEEMQSLKPISDAMEESLRSLLVLVAPKAKMPLKPSEKLGKKLKPILGRNFKEEGEEEDTLGWLLGPTGKKLLGIKD